MTTFTYSSFLTLTNKVLTRLNEVNLTSSNFSQAVGFQVQAQEAVNSAIREINSQQYEWPFNHVYNTKVLTPGVPFYALPDDCKTVDWDTFYVQQDNTLASPQQATYLPYIDYDEYVQKYQAQDQNADTSSHGPPLNIYRTQNMEFGVTPFPDQAYTINYQYWKIVTDMVNYNDNASVPNIFDWVIINGAMYYCYMFRENLQAAGTAQNEFRDGIKQMRYIYLRDDFDLRDRRAGPQFAMRG